MKELKFNLKLIFQRKETYIAIIGILAVNLYHVFLLIKPYLNDGIVIEWIRSAEEQFILTNNWTLSIRNIIMIVFPILSSIIIADTSWIEIKNNTENILYTRLSLKKSIVIRWILSILITFMITLFGFILNYVALYYIFGSGHYMVDYPVSAYNFIVPELFLSDLRLNQPILYIIFASLHYSIIMSLLSGIAYSFSFIMKQRVIIYFQTLFLMIISSLLLTIIGCEEISLLSQLIIAADRTITDSIITYIYLFLLGVIPLFFLLRKRDVLK